jgi:pilus assembly protein Flp/PilA
MAVLLRFLRCEAGATSIEYGLIAAGISVAIVAVVSGMGTAMSSKYDSLATALK